jgi:hypothetical protein
MPSWIPHASSASARTIALCSIWGAKRLSAPRADLLASLTAWLMWLDTALNVFENLALLHVIRSLEPAPLLPIAAGIFSFRSVTLAAGQLVGVTLQFLVIWRSRAAGA